MIKKYWIYAFFVFAVVLFAFKRLQTPKQNAQVNATMKTFHTEIGWGYNVYRNDSLYIHQEYMPAVEGRKGFDTEADAKKIAELVLEKMKKSDLPVITVEEIKATIVSARF
jgi:hypothetical protein